MALPVQEIRGDVYINGNLQAKTQTYPATSIANADIAAAAAIAASKLEHRHNIMYSQESDTQVPSDATYPIFNCYGATGTTVAFEAGSVTPCTVTRTVTVDLLKNGVSVLAAAIVLDVGNAARTPEAAVVDTSAIADGDLLEIDIAKAGAAGDYAKGLYCTVVINEDASP